MDKKKGEKVISNSIFNFISVLINRGGSLIFIIILARILQPELFGLYSLALSIVLIILTIGNFGIDEALTRYVASNYKNSPKKAKAYFRYLLKLKASILIIAAVLLILLSKVFAIFYSEPGLTFPLMVAAFYLIAMSFSQFFSSLFYTFQNVKIYSIKEVVFQSSRILLLPTILTLAVSFWVSGVFFILALAALLTATFSLVIISNKYKFLFSRTTGKKAKIDKKEVYNYLKYLAIGALTGIFFLYIDVLILGKFVSLEYIGFYRAATTIVLSIVALVSFVPVLYPIFSQLSGNKLKSLFNKGIYYSSIITIPATIGLLFIAKPFIIVIYGESYLPAVVPLYALSFLIFSFGIGDFFSILLNAKGKSKYTAKAIFIATIINVVLNLILIINLLPYGEIYAVLGAALATLVSRYYHLFAVALFSKRIFKVNINCRFLIKPLIATLIMSIFLFFFNSLSFKTLNIFILIIEITVAASIYLSVLFLIKGINKEDLSQMRNLVRYSRKSL